MAATLYEPSRKPLISGTWLKRLVVLLVLVGAGAYLHERHPDWLKEASLTVLGWFGQETVTVDVVVSQTRADILLDGVRMTELPLHVRKDDAQHSVSAIAPGYLPATATFKADGDKQLFLTLRPNRGR